VAYEVSTPVYEGPFDLLLHLILRDEVELWDVSLSAIVDAYLAELEQMQTVDLDLATEFLLIAATLVELKARRLLPGIDEVELDEELLRFEERDLLLARLLECKTFKDAAKALEARIRHADRSIPRHAGPEEPFRSLVPDPLERVSITALRDAARRALTPRPAPVVDTDHIAPIRASVRDAVELVLRLLPGTEAMSFRAIVAGVEHRLDFVVRFLAVLELYREKAVALEQAEPLGELYVTWTGAEEGEVVVGDDYSGRPAEAEKNDDE
jgi:segregation and condensation protein A